MSLSLRRVSAQESPEKPKAAGCREETLNADHSPCGEGYRNPHWEEAAVSFSRGALPLTWLHGRASPPGAAHFGTVLPRSVRFCLLRFPPTKEAAAAAFPPPSGKETEEGGRARSPPARLTDRPVGRGSAASRCAWAPPVGPPSCALDRTEGQPRGRSQLRGCLVGEPFYIDSAPVPRPRTGARITNSFARQSAGRDLYPLQPPPPPDHQCLGTRRRRRLVLQPTPHPGLQTPLASFPPRLRSQQGGLYGERRSRPARNPAPRTNQTRFLHSAFGGGAERFGNGLVISSFHFRCRAQPSPVTRAFGKALVPPPRHSEGVTPT